MSDSIYVKGVSDCEENAEKIDMVVNEIDDVIVSEDPILNEVLNDDFNGDGNEGEDEDEDDDEDEDEDVKTMIKKLKNKGKKRGRRSPWSDTYEAALVDVIANDENLKRKLIYENMKKVPNGKLYEKIVNELKLQDYPFTVDQTRNKFKNMIKECKKAALTAQTATGIQRYRDSKGFGRWFDVLYPLIKARDSCQPEQGVEPVAEQNENDYHEDNSLENDENASSDTVEKAGNRTGVKTFVPLKEKSGKRRKLEDLTEEIVKAVNKMTEQDDTKALLEFMEKENERKRQAHLEMVREENKQFMAMMQMMMGCTQQQQQQQQHPSFMPSPLHHQSAPLPRPFAASQPGPSYIRQDSINFPSSGPYRGAQSSPLEQNIISPIPRSYTDQLNSAQEPLGSPTYDSSY